MKRPLLIVALTYVGGVLTGNSFKSSLGPLFALSFLFLVVALTRTETRPHLLWVLVPLVGWTNMATRKAVISPIDLRTLAGTNAEYLTLRGTLSETPSQRVYEHRDNESWHTLARLDVTALQRGTNWQPAFGRAALTTPGILGTNFFGGQIAEVTGVIRPPKGPAAEGLFDYGAYLRRQ